MSLVRLRELSEHSAVRVPHVSSWSIGMHVQHCVLAAVGICRVLESSRAPPPRTWRTLVGRFVLWRGRLPRRRATAPPVTVPEVELSSTQLEALLGGAASVLEQARALPADSWFGHFALGTLRRDEALRFIDVHTNHHLRIVAEILAAHDRGAQSPG